MNKGFQDYWLVREDWKCKCERCGYTWIATQDPKTVVQCPACRSRCWNKPRHPVATKPQDSSIAAAFGEDIIDEPPPKTKKKKKSKADDEDAIGNREDE
ncbi:MAG: hypothetical protein MUP55_00040 [Candidatus Aenigmarchaeota archaeon]|nr:hypothetical protein [Candidatus Aenigmarchaeota archaeon]